MEIFRDFKELLASFNENAVEYLIVGGYALAHHGAPRFTGDLDLYVNPSPDNAKRVLAALDAFGFGSVALTEDDFRQPGRVVQLGVPPVRVDLITSIDGVTWDEAWRGRTVAALGDVSVSFLGRREFIANKRACGRARDLADIEALGEDPQRP